MTSRRRRSRRRSGGQALLEFALVFPLIMLLFMGIVDLGRGIFAYNEISNAAREGTRTAIVNQDPTDVVARAAAQAISLGIPTSGYTCPVLDGPTTSPAGICVTFLKPDLSAVCSPLAVGCVADVNVKYTFTPVTPIISSLVGQLVLTSTSREPIENVCTTSGCPLP